MLEKLLNRLLHDDQPQPRQHTRRFELHDLKMLFSHFPIGRKLHYYPEFLREATLETIVIGYGLNDRFIYANDDIETDAEGAPVRFRVPGNEPLRPDELDRIFILVPDTTEQERDLTYDTRAELSRTGQFAKGNIITLVAESAARGTPTMDTVVSRRLVMKDGPFVNDAAVFLEPDFSTLAVADKRKQQRIPTDIRASLFYGKDAYAQFRCMLHDFSEHSLRLEVGSADQAMPTLQVNDKVLVEFALTAAEPVYKLQGKVLRIDDTTCVVRIEQLFVDGEFRKIRLMDVIEIKTHLLNTAS